MYVLSNISVFSQVNNDPRYSGRPLARAVLKALGEIQGVFLGLLSDPKSKHLSRESCCLGIVACHGIVTALPQSPLPEETTQSLSVRLMNAFGQTTNYAGSVMQETSAQAALRRAAERNEQNNLETPPDIMEPFGMNEAGGVANMGEAALGAYREMAAASVALGRPDVLYDLLLLSVSHECWFTVSSRERYGAIALTSGGLNHLKMREALKPHLGKLLPKILRACNDPNKQTREQMTSLLSGLTGGGAETRESITFHCVEVVDVLLKDSASKFWRARVGACGALSDVIVGRYVQPLSCLFDIYLFSRILSENGQNSVAVVQFWKMTFYTMEAQLVSEPACASCAYGEPFFVHSTTCAKLSVKMELHWEELSVH